MLFVVLLAFWIVLAWRFTPLSLGFGAAAAALVTGLTRDRLIAIGAPPHGVAVPVTHIAPVALMRRGLQWIVAIARANVQVARLVLHPRLPVDPALLQFRTGLEGAVPEFVLASLITLTPGTVTLDLEDGRYLVHALDPRLAADLLSGQLPNEVAEIFGQPRRPLPMIRPWSHSIREIVT